MTEAVLAPVTGRVTPLDEVPDEVFAAQMVGPGVAIAPAGHGVVRVLAPVTGTVAKLHPHAFVITSPEGASVLVHVGIDTVQLKGRGFALLVRESRAVSAGDPVVEVDLTVVEDAGYSASCPVVVLGAAPGSVDSPAVGRDVTAGDRLYDLP